jgi:hypothetical protein
MYLVCYPQGGWNDMMSRIWYCFQYSILTNRVLIIDTTKNWFRDDLFSYLSFSFPNLYRGDISHFITNLYNTHSVYPSGMKGMNNDELPTIIWKRPGHMETETGIVLSTRLDQSYDETVVVYADCGSLIHINPILCYTTFTPMVLEYVQRRWNQLPKGYLSVHVRNTDYKSPVDDFIKQHHDLFCNHPVFIASDHSETIHRFQHDYGAYSFSTIPALPIGKNIHESIESQSLRSSHELVRTFNLDTLSDFLLLACGSEFYYSSHQSGFSRSVAYLHKDQGLLHFLIPFLRSSVP